MNRSIATLCLLFALTGCYTIRTNAPPNAATAFASSGEPCATVSTRRVHYAIAGLVALNSNEVTVPGNARARVVTETDALDVVLRALGVAFTLGLYGGSQSARVEICPAMVAGAPLPAPAAPIVMPAPPPPPRIEIPVVIGAGTIGLDGGGRGAGSRVRRPVRDSDQAICSFGTDSGFGEFCRDRGDGIKLCMGNGMRGDFCAFGTDCGSSLFCRPSGDGFKRCQ